MKFATINTLITNHNFYFQSWDDRYSKGVWAALGTYDGEIDIVRDLSNAGDLDMIPAMDYILYSETDWLPYVTGNNFMDALMKLEQRLEKLPQDQFRHDTVWSDSVYTAIHRLFKATYKKSAYSDTDPVDALSPPTKSFADILKYYSSKGK